MLEIVFRVTPDGGTSFVVTLRGAGKSPATQYIGSLQAAMITLCQRLGMPVPSMINNSLH